eukprot:gene22571-biopygen7217
MQRPNVQRSTVQRTKFARVRTPPWRRAWAPRAQRGAEVPLVTFSAVGTTFHTISVFPRAVTRTAPRARAGRTNDTDGSRVAWLFKGVSWDTRPGRRAARAAVRGLPRRAAAARARNELIYAWLAETMHSYKLRGFETAILNSKSPTVFFYRLVALFFGGEPIPGGQNPFFLTNPHSFFLQVCSPIYPVFCHHDLTVIPPVLRRPQIFTASGRIPERIGGSCRGSFHAAHSVPTRAVGRNGSGRGPDAGRTIGFKETDADGGKTNRGKATGGIVNTEMTAMSPIVPYNPLTQISCEHNKLHGNKSPNPPATKSMSSDDLMKEQTCHSELSWGSRTSAKTTSRWRDKATAAHTGGTKLFADATKAVHQTQMNFHGSGPDSDRTRAWPLLPLYSGEARIAAAISVGSPSASAGAAAAMPSAAGAGAAGCGGSAGGGSTCRMLRVAATALTTMVRGQSTTDSRPIHGREENTPSRGEGKDIAPHHGVSSPPPSRRSSPRRRSPRGRRRPPGRRRPTGLHHRQCNLPLTAAAHGTFGTMSGSSWCVGGWSLLCYLIEQSTGRVRWNTPRHHSPRPGGALRQFWFQFASSPGHKGAGQFAASGLGVDPLSVVPIPRRAGRAVTHGRRSCAVHARALR